MQSQPHACFFVLRSLELQSLFVILDLRWHWLDSLPSVRRGSRRWCDDNKYDLTHLSETPPLLASVAGGTKPNGSLGSLIVLLTKVLAVASEENSGLQLSKFWSGS